MLTWLRGIWLLRHPELVRDLGERTFHLRRIAAIARTNSTCRIGRDIRLDGNELGKLQLGEHAAISAGTVLSFGDERNGFGTIAIGDRTWIGQYNNLRAGGGDIQIGSDCLISQFCTLIASNHGCDREIPINRQPPEPKRRGVILQDDVWLGAGTVITAGVTIGRGGIVGANAVVTNDIPPYEIWAGVPARKIGDRKAGQSMETLEIS